MQTKTLQMQNVHHPSLSFVHLVFLSPGLCKAILLIKVDGRHLIWSNAEQKLKCKMPMNDNSYIFLPNLSVPTCNIIETKLFNLVLPGPATCCPVYRKLLLSISISVSLLFCPFVSLPQSVCLCLKHHKPC